MTIPKHYSFEYESNERTKDQQVVKSSNDIIKHEMKNTNFYDGWECNWLVPLVTVIVLSKLNGFGIKIGYTHMPIDFKFTVIEKWLIV